MPLPIAFAHRLAERLAAVRKDGHARRTCVRTARRRCRVRYRDGRPVGIEKLLISTQHAEGADASADQRRPLGARRRCRCCPSELYDADSCARTFWSTRPAGS